VVARDLGVLLLGIYVGGVLLAVFAATLAVPVEQFGGSVNLALIAVIVVGLLVLMDVWSLARLRWFPLGPKRQASQRLDHDDRLEWWATGVVWGIDLGLGVTTYRVTSGVWMLIVLSILTPTPAWVVLLYSTGFAAGLVIRVLQDAARLAEGDVDTVAIHIESARVWRHAVHFGYVLIVAISIPLWVG